MDEGGGGFHTRQNIMYRSTLGGVLGSWSSATMGAPFNPPGDGLCDNPFFAKMNPIWRHQGWGQPGVGFAFFLGPVVHYAYAAHGTGLDNGDILYVRSIDNGATWSAPIKLNQDTDGQYKTQWMPSLSVNYFELTSCFSCGLTYNTVTVSWYDRRSATSACTLATNPGCRYERYGVQSRDNGVTWSADFAVSDGLIPQPTQNDPGVQSCYAGDYDYSTALAKDAYVTWTDGRVAVGGVQVQNVEFQHVRE
jgi:hypothetical protein